MGCSKRVSDGDTRLVQAFRLCQGNRVDFLSVLWQNQPRPKVANFMAMMYCKE